MYPGVSAPGSQGRGGNVSLAGKNGLIGSTIPVTYGGGGADLLTNALVKEELCRVAAGFGMSVNMCTTNFCYLISRYGTEEQKERYIPPVIQGDAVAAFCLTEPEAGSDALSIKTGYRKEGNKYIINGSKTFITNAPVARYFMMVTRKQGTKGSTGGTLFILDIAYSTHLLIKHQQPIRPQNV